MTVNGQNQSELWGTFGIGRRAKGGPVKLKEVGNEVQFFESSFKGFLDAFSILHKRIIIFIEKSFWVVLDCIKSEDSFKKIMVCLDGSKHSEKALSQAVQIAKKFESKVILVHIIEPTAILSSMQNSADPYWGSISVPLVESSLKKEREEGKKILTKNARILEKENISFEIMLLLGRPSEEILNFSKKECVDLIVVGSLGKGMLSRVLLGSVSSSISQRACCTVIIVR